MTQMMTLVRGESPDIIVCLLWYQEGEIYTPAGGKHSILGMIRRVLEEIIWTKTGKKRKEKEDENWGKNKSFTFHSMASPELVV